MRVIRSEAKPENLKVPTGSGYRTLLYYLDLSIAPRIEVLCIGTLEILYRRGPLYGNGLAWTKLPRLQRFPIDRETTYCSSQHAYSALGSFYPGSQCRDCDPFLRIEIGSAIQNNK